MRLVLERVLQGLAVLLAVSLITFALAYLLPADPARRPGPHGGGAKRQCGNRT